MQDSRSTKPPGTELLEEESVLVRRAKAGDYRAFETLVSKVEQSLYTMARRIVGRPEDAEDVVQDALASAIEHLPQFREEASFGTWITRIVTNQALKLLRKRRGLATVPLEEDHGIALPHPEFIAPWARDADEAAADPRLFRLIEEALTELDEKYRTVFLLRDVEGRSTAATAEALGISEGNVKVRLLRARLQLRERLTRALGDPARRIEPPAEHR